MSDHRFVVVSSHGKITPHATAAEALAAPKAEGFVWLDYFNPTKEELAELCEPLGIHQLTVEDCLDDEQIPKIEEFPTYTFILLNAFSYQGRELTMEELDCMLGKGFLVTVHRSATGQRLFDGRFVEALALDTVNVRKGPDRLLHVALDRVVDAKLRALEGLQEELDDKEETILERPGEFRPAELMRLRRRLLAIRKSLFHEREALMKVCRKDSPFVTEKAIFHFRDIYDHLARFFELAELCREMISGLMETYLSMQNNRMSAAANYTNQVMRRLTLITTVFMPLTLIAGIGGMSEWSMITGPDNWRVSYPAFLLGMLAIAVVNYLLLRWVDARRRTADLGKLG